MISFTARITRFKISVAIFILLIAICFTTATVYCNRFEKAGSTLKSGSTVSERIKFLEQFGWQCDENDETCKDTVIPSEFDDVYEPYNQIQLSQGFDLVPFKGKTVKLYSIRILNYPENSEYVYATLLVDNGTVIGGDIHSTSLNGFMHGFNKSNG